MLCRLQPQSLSTTAYRALCLALCLIVVLSLALLAGGRAQAAPVVDGRFDLSGNPERIALGPDGNLWVTVAGPTEVARITPAGAVTEFDVPTLDGAVGIGAGPDGKVWVTFSTKVGRFDPADPVGSAEAFAADVVSGQNLVTGPDGNLWTPSADKLLRITPAATPVVTAFTILTAGVDIASGGGQLWISDPNGGEVVSATTDGVPTRYPTGGNPRGVAVGPGGLVGYTDPASPHSVGRIVAGGLPQPTLVTPGTDPFGMTAGADAAFWFAQPFGNNLGRLTTDGTYSELGDFGAEAGPRYVVAGPGNTLWVALQGLNGNAANKVARVSGLEPPVPPSNGGGNGPAPTNVAPVLSGLAVTPKRFRVAKAPTAAVARQVADTAARRRGGKRKPAAPAGTKIAFALSEAATVKLSFERMAVGGKCVKPTRTLRGAKRCTRWVAAGALTRRDLAAGKRSVAFSGRVGRRALRVGSYRVTAVATDSGGLASTPQRARFKVVSR
jgi:streptogramin lyase